MQTLARSAWNTNKSENLSSANLLPFCSSHSFVSSYFFTTTRLASVPSCTLPHSMLTFKYFSNIIYKPYTMYLSHSSVFHLFLFFYLIMCRSLFFLVFCWLHCLSTTHLVRLCDVASEQWIAVPVMRVDEQRTQSQQEYQYRLHRKVEKHGTVSKPMKVRSFS